MPQDTSTIRDLLYFDFDKAASIWSQFADGLLEKVSVAEEIRNNQKGGATLGIPGIAEASLGSSTADKTSILESRLLHHNLLNLLEVQLENAGLLLDLSAAIDSSELSAENIRKKIGNSPYIRASGASVIEDYQRIFKIACEFKKLNEFIKQCNKETIKQTPEFQEVINEIEKQREFIKKIKSRNQKSEAKAKLKALETTVSNLPGSYNGAIDDWLLEGIQHWIKTFVPTRLNFRVYPFPNCPACHIICNLKRNCFVDQDLEHLLYGFGSKPNIALSVVGLITSLPSHDVKPFDPLQEFYGDEKMDSKRTFEKAFRSMFGAMDEIEDFMRYSHYPNLTVHPIAVFRSFDIS